MQPLDGALPLPMCQCRLHAVLRSHIGILKRILAAESVFPSHAVSLCNDLADFDRRIPRAGPMFFYWPKLLYPILSSTIFPFFFFLSTGWYCGAGVLACRLLTPSLALPTSFNNNNNNNNNFNNYKVN